MLVFLLYVVYVIFVSTKDFISTCSLMTCCVKYSLEFVWKDAH